MAIAQQRGSAERGESSGCAQTTVGSASYFSLPAASRETARGAAVRLAGSISRDRQRRGGPTNLINDLMQSFCKQQSWSLIANDDALGTTCSGRASPEYLHLRIRRNDGSTQLVETG
jgi:hypothetical protein